MPANPPTPEALTRAQQFAREFEPFHPQPDWRGVLVRKLVPLFTHAAEQAEHVERERDELAEELRVALDAKDREVAAARRPLLERLSTHDAHVERLRRALEEIRQEASACVGLSDSALSSEYAASILQRCDAVLAAALAALSARSADETVVATGFLRGYRSAPPSTHQPYPVNLHDNETDAPIDYRDVLHETLRQIPEGERVEIVVRRSGERNPKADDEWVRLRPHKYGPRSALYETQP